MTRGQIWLAGVGGKPRPVLVLTRSEVIDVRRLVTVAEITSSMRGLTAEVVLDHQAIRLDEASAVICDAIHTATQSSLTRHIGDLDEATMSDVCEAISCTLGR